MSSILKILVDIQCLVYCDFEQVGEAFPNSIFRLELRKGTYLLDFKIDGTTIVSKDYIMKSDNEEDLLRINLSDAFLKYKREQKYSEIAKINADIHFKDGAWWIINKDNGYETKIMYNLADHSYSNRKSFDMVGLRSVNIGGKEVDNWAYYAIEGGKWGCINKQGEIQIPTLYDGSIYFYNDKVAKAFLEGKSILINKYGEQLYEDLYDSLKGDFLKGDFLQNQIVCKDWKYGVIDTNGKWIIPAIYDNLDRLNGDNIRFIIKANNKYGIADHNNNILLPCIYDSVVSNKYIISVCRNNKWGVFDNKLSPIIPIEYEILDKDNNYNDKRPVLVCKNGYYGILNINISHPECISSWNGELNQISEIVPCVYNALYSEFGQEKEPSVVKFNDFDEVFFVNKDKETLHCYKYKLQELREENCLPSYTAVNIQNFVCDSFTLVDGYFMYTYNGLSTIIIGKTTIRIRLEGNKIAKIVSLPNVDKHLFQVGKNLWIFENATLIETIDNVELKENNHIVYGLKKDGKYAIYTPEFVQCTQFEYDSLSIDCDKYNDDSIVEFSKIIENRRIYGEYSCLTKSVVSYGFLDSRLIRSQYNWAEKFNFSNKKEGIISFNPNCIVVPFNYDYIRFYTGKKSTVFVVSKEFDNYPKRRYALMSTRFDLLTSFIFSTVSSWWTAQGLKNYIRLNLIPNNGIHAYSDFDLSQKDIERFAPFFCFEHDIEDEYDDHNRPISTHREFTEPFKNVRLFVDTETTGLPINASLPFTELDNWPYLVQVALIIEDDNYGILARRNIVLKPDGYIIPDTSIKVHGISNETALKNGEDRDKVISFLDVVLCNSDIIIGHNVSFDLNVIKSEIIRVKGKENALFVNKNHKIIDTMILGMDICKIPNMSYPSLLSQPYKYPKLDELYYCLFKRYIVGHHDAMADVQATYDCYHELQK